MSFLIEHGQLFGVTDPATQLVEQDVRTDALGHTCTTYRQVYRGIPVFSGVLKVHQDQSGAIIAANGDYYPISNKLNTVPDLDETMVRALLWELVPAADVEVERLELVIVDPGWYGDPPAGAHLAYDAICTSPSESLREAFFIDAHTGEVLDRWSMIHTGLDRQIFDGLGGDVLPGDLARGEGAGPVVSPEDVNRAYDYLGDAYGYYERAFGRDGIDNAGLTMVATVNFLYSKCPNAFWNGFQMAFCDQVVTDDVVIHELTHGVTDYSANLIYQNQSGQLNESFSDVFGELADLFNGDAAFPGPPGGTAWPAHPTGPGLDTPNNLRTTGCPGAALLVNAPAGIEGIYRAARASFGPALTTNGVMGGVVDADPLEACDAGGPLGAGIAGMIALVDRGSCAFAEKVLNAQDAGAIAVIVVNNISGPPVRMGGDDPTITIPSIMISQDDGALIRAALTSDTVNVTLKDQGYADGVRWLVGEDSVAFGGAIRDMWDPTCFGHPDYANSPFQTCNPNDGGGVHSGSGIPNHAFAMLTDGHAFNGYTISGIGPIKSGAVWYRTLTVYLTPGSDFEDAYWSFNQAATDLIGTDPLDPRTGLASGNPFTAADAAEVDKALLAVEMNTPGSCGWGDDVVAPDLPELCLAPTLIFLDEFESGPGGWTVFNSNPPTPYDWVQTNGLPFGRSGVAWFVADANIGDCVGQDESASHSLQSPSIALPADVTFPMLGFTHHLASEGGWDGGTVRVRANGGSWQTVPRSAFHYNSYNGRINTFAQGNTNPLAGEPAFTGAGGQWGTSLVDLGGLVSGGDTLEVRFDFGKDGCTGGVGWYVDDFEVFDCPDCNTSGEADHREFAFSAASAVLNPIGDGWPQLFTLAAPPAAGGDVRMSFTGVGDFSDIAEWIDVDINGVWVGSLFQTGAIDCAATPKRGEIIVPTSIFNTAVGGGDASINLVATADVNASRCDGDSYVTVFVEYDLLPPDCNTNGVLDECDVSEGTSPDCNNNTVPDECDIAGSTSDDVNGSGVPDECERVHNITQDTLHATIQDAVDASSNGDVIEVFPGTYVLTAPVLVDKEIRITGDTSAPGNVVVSFDSSPGDDWNCFSVIADHVTIEGFTIQGARCRQANPGADEYRSAGVMVGGTDLHTDSAPPGGEIAGLTDITIEHNEFVDCCFDVYIYKSNNCTIAHNDMHDGRPESAGHSAFYGDEGIVLHDDGTSVTGIDIHDNDIYEHMTGGIELNSVAGPVTIRGNRIYDNDGERTTAGGFFHYGRGVFVSWNSGPVSNVTISDNVFSGHVTETGDLSFVADTGAIIAEDIVDWLIQDNDFYGNAVGVLIKSGTNVVLTGNLIHDNARGIDINATGEARHNALYDNNLTDWAADGMTNFGLQAAQSFDAENNWWGDPSGPLGTSGLIETPPCNTDPADDLNLDGLGDAVLGQADYCPWLACGDGDATSNGFQLDSDCDGVLDDGDLSGTGGDAPCTGGATVGCDDNCPGDPNPSQDDSDGNGIGDVCEPPPADVVIYDYDSDEFICNPDMWTFFGYAQNWGGGFGWTNQVPDGSGAFQSVNWTECDAQLGSSLCQFAGATIGQGIFMNCYGAEGGTGIDDANLDLSDGTALSVRVETQYAPGAMQGTQLSLILTDIDGTTAVTPGNIASTLMSQAMRDTITRRCRVPLEPGWQTVTFLFDQLTWLWDSDHSTHGNPHGLDLTHIKEVTLFWQRNGSDGMQLYRFDEMTLVQVPSLLSHDFDSDGDVDLADFGAYQACYTDPGAAGCEALDADYDGDVDSDDVNLYTSCLKGPLITTDSPRTDANFDYYFGWCYPTLIESGYIDPGS